MDPRLLAAFGLGGGGSGSAFSQAPTQGGQPMEQTGGLFDIIAALTGQTAMGRGMPGSGQPVNSQHAMGRGQPGTGRPMPMGNGIGDFLASLGQSGVGRGQPGTGQPMGGQQIGGYSPGVGMRDPNDHSQGLQQIFGGSGPHGAPGTGGRDGTGVPLSSMVKRRMY